MYKSIPHLMRDLDCSESTVYRIIREMKKSGRYPPEDFLIRPKRVKWESVINFCGREHD